ncbi:alpha/beta hydrolase [Noviherbaspirillum sp.]|uniref:dienelactone hydrolase family protein n=1 Tax=Noviherbaspirillum sp. TaxID=1926288 RepID=UPI002D72BEE5|nr:alpha/beta hydrolase [Noviherbaspirillum sp.]HZW20977.1 alpha/beta hydrolase [Noviherbaspirillum sp.]
MASMMDTELVTIPCNGVKVEGMLELPSDPVGIVLFAHGSGSSRLSPRNNYVAAALRQSQIGTLLMDLLTLAEDEDEHLRFNIALLAERLGIAVDWLQKHGSTASLPVALFGASTGAAAALQVAAARPDDIAAVVSRGGRPDLAGEAVLPKVIAPTLLIVGGFDLQVIDLNQAAFAALRCEKHLEIVPEAGHLFEEPGKLAKVSALASAWFIRHMSSPEDDSAGPVKARGVSRAEKRLG